MYSISLPVWKGGKRRRGRKGESSGVDIEIVSPQGQVIPGQSHANAKEKRKEEIPHRKRIRIISELY